MAFCICRSGHPTRPCATACCFFSSFKTLLTGTKDNFPRPLNVLSRYGWPVLGVHRGPEAVRIEAVIDASRDFGDVLLRRILR
jgi:hypothetical protein